MTDETKKPDEIDQAALDAHPEEQPGNAAGGASSDEQSTEGSAAPVAAGDVGEQGNDAAAAADGAQAAGDAPVDGGDVGNGVQAVPVSDASASSSDTATEPEPLPLGAGGVIVPVADHTPEDDAQLAAADKAGATVEDDSGNVVAGGAPAVVTSSPANDTPTINPNSDEHPLKTRARWLRMKFEAEEAVVMSHIVDLLREIEETL